MTRASKVHSERAHDCSCGRVVYGNGGMTSHRRACSGHYLSRSQVIDRPTPQPSTPSPEGAEPRDIWAQRWADFSKRLTNEDRLDSASRNALMDAAHEAALAAEALGKAIGRREAALPEPSLDVERLAEALKAEGFVRGVVSRYGNFNDVYWQQSAETLVARLGYPVHDNEAALRGSEGTPD